MKLLILLLNAVASLNINIVQQAPASVYIFLKFRNNKSCKGCVHYMEETRKCHKFLAFKDSLHFDYESAFKCRMDPNKCGMQGKYFVEQ